MELVDMSHEERVAMMQKRHAFLSSLATNCTTLKDFIEKYEEHLGVIGWNLAQYPGDNYLSLTIWLDYGEYECYHIYVKEEALKVSAVIEWQDECCANDIFNIFEDVSVDKDEICKS